MIVRYQGQEYDLPPKTKEKIEELACEICYEAYNYRYPNSPSTLFTVILSLYCRVEPVEIWIPQWSDCFLGDREWDLVADWMRRTGEICSTTDDFQYLYDLLYNNCEGIEC